MDAVPPDRRLGLAHAILLAAACAAEAALFAWSTARYQAWVPPRWFDQLQYLGEAYDAWDRARSHGLWEALREAFARGSPQGTLHPALALAVFGVAGPTRSAALFLNLLALVGLQAVTFVAVRHLARSYAWAWAAVGLLAGLHFPWSGSPGSAADFRLDWMGACAFGATLGMAILSDGMRSTRGALGTGLCAGVTLLVRFITAVYLGLIFWAALLWMASRPGRGARCARLGLAGAVAAAMAGPALWHSRGAIYAYYWVGQFSGPSRAVLDSHMPWGAAMAWILSGVVRYQMGLPVLLAGIGSAGALLWMRYRLGGASATGEGRGLGRAAWTVAGFVGAPACVLMLHPDKAEQTLCILAPGAVWMLVLACIRLSSGLPRRSAAWVASAAAAAGGLAFVHAETVRPYTAEEEAEFRRIVALDDYLRARSEEAGLHRPQVAVTWMLDALNASTLEVVGRERNQAHLPFLGMLPTGVLEPDRASVMRLLSASDFACLVSRAPEHYPFDRAMEARLPEIRAWCEAHLRRVGQLDTRAWSMTLYERRDLAPSQGDRVRWDAYQSAAATNPVTSVAAPPSAPWFVSPRHALASTRARFHASVAAAYSPVRYRALSLPPGVTLDPVTGEIAGRLARPGTYELRVAAANALGSTEERVEVHVEDTGTYSQLEAPARVHPGETIHLRFGAYDAGGHLDFVEITDLSEGRTLTRIGAPDDAKQAWESGYTLTLARPGRHDLLLRTVCFDPDRKDKYSFIDRACAVEVAP